MGAMWLSNGRQQLQLLVIVFFTFIAFAAADAAWMPWVRPRPNGLAVLRALTVCL
jgi:hypothetical protein